MLYCKWIQFFTEFSQLKSVCVERCIKPGHAVGKPSLVIFSDASSEAYGAVAYARWQLLNGQYKANIIASKNRIAPVNSHNIVRLELAGAVLSARLRSFIQSEMRYDFKEVYHIVDSEIVKAMVNKSSYGLNTFAVNRIGEIRETTHPEEWLWTAGVNNIADWITRGKSPKEISMESEWQQGKDVDAVLDQPFARARLTYQQVIPFDPDIHPDRIRFGEVTDILGKVNTRKACGPDHITNKIIRYLLPTLHIIIQDLINICVFHGYHPRAWKRAWALMIHKPSKRRSDPCSYRPISLLCCLSKVFEAIMTKRLMSWAENTDQLPTEQSGFRKHHSTNDKLFELTQAVCQAQRLSTRVGAVFLDIEKAFDRVWHNG